MAHVELLVRAETLFRPDFMNPWEDVATAARNELLPVATPDALVGVAVSIEYETYDESGQNCSILPRPTAAVRTSLSNPISYQGLGAQAISLTRRCAATHIEAFCTPTSKSVLLNAVKAMAAPSVTGTWRATVFRHGYLLMHTHLARMLPEARADQLVKALLFPPTSSHALLAGLSEMQAALSAMTGGSALTSFDSRSSQTTTATVRLSAPDIFAA